MEIRISADSTCDLSPELCARYGVTLAPLTVLVDADTFHDGVDIHPDDIFRAVDAGRKVCTAAVNQAEYETLFRQLRRTCDAVIHICIGSGFSACYQNALAAARTVGNVYVLDSRNLTTGSGLLVLDAVEMARAGHEPEAIMTALKQTLPRIDVSFVVSTTDYLYRGGRCSGLEAFGAKLLHIRPSIELTDGAMKPGKKYRGSFRLCLEHYISDKLADWESVDTARIFITHSPCEEGIVSFVQSELSRHGTFGEVYETMAGCTVSTHCGPGTLGILFKRRQPKH